ncbi:uroporphyrinogen-III synthase [Ancylobacter terrae]|uniref:uroporphyrinogen-III synthase n=1 Tax=Ancylobacter sp. sgz301288 TaxID=3342077 RepID=UPI00385DA20A
MRILITRPRPDADATAARLERLGWPALVDPMLTIEPIAEARLDDVRYDAVALTSVNGARELARRPELARLRTLPLHAVGHRTAAAAPAGFPRVTVASGTGAAMAVMMRAELPAGTRVVHVAGEDRAVDLGAALAGTGIEVDLFVIYRAVASGELSPATIAALRAGTLDAALHYSPRTAATLVGAARAAGLLGALGRLRHLCFSANVAAPLRAAGIAAEAVASPTEEALIEALAAPAATSAT